MIVASFGPTTGWLGKPISFENGGFVLEGHGPISASDVMEYDRQGHLVWANEATRDWVAAGGSAEPPYAAVVSGDIVAESRLIQAHKDSVTSMAVTRDGLCAVTASHDATVRLWDLVTFQALRAFDVGVPATPDSPYGNWVRCVALTPDGRRVVAGSDDGMVRVWDRGSDGAPLILSGHVGFIGGVAVTPDGRRVVSASHDKTLKVWDAASGAELMTLAGHEDIVSAVAVTPDGRLAISASSDKTLMVWDLGTGALVRTLHGHTKVANAMAVTADGLGVVSGGGDKAVRLWDIASGAEVQSMVGHQWAVESVAVTPDGRLAISGCNDGSIIAWELATGRQVRTFAGRRVVDKTHGEGIGALAVTPDGRQLLSGSADHTLRAWVLPEPGPAVTPRVAPEAPVAPPPAAPPPVPEAAAAPGSSPAPVAVTAVPPPDSTSWPAAYVLATVREALSRVLLTEGTVESPMTPNRPKLRIKLEGLTPADFHAAVPRLTAEGYVDTAHMDKPPLRLGRWMDTGQLSATEAADPRMDLVIDGIGDRRAADGGTASFVLSAVDIATEIVAALTTPLKEDRIWMTLHVMPSDMTPVIDALGQAFGRPPGGGFALTVCFAAGRTTMDSGYPGGSCIEVA